MEEWLLATIPSGQSLQKYHICTQSLSQPLQSLAKSALHLPRHNQILERDLIAFVLRKTGADIQYNCSVAELIHKFCKSRFARFKLEQLTTHHRLPFRHLPLC